MVIVHTASRQANKISNNMSKINDGGLCTTKKLGNLGNTLCQAVLLNITLLVGSACIAILKVNILYSAAVGRDYDVLPTFHNLVPLYW